MNFIIIIIIQVIKFYYLIIQLTIYFHFLHFIIIFDYLLQKSYQLALYLDLYLFSQKYYFIIYFYLNQNVNYLIGLVSLNTIITYR